jgi:hypothetical protein
MKNPTRPVLQGTSGPNFSFKLVYFQFYRLLYYGHKSSAESVSIDYHAGILAGRLHKKLLCVRSDAYKPWLVYTLEIEYQHNSRLLNLSPTFSPTFKNRSLIWSSMVK